MFYLIGIGMGDEKDISVRGLEAVKTCSKVFLECYTSKLVNFDIKKMEELYDKKIILADRYIVEKKCEEEMLNVAKEENIALLIVGSPLGATTHWDILKRAKELGIKTEVIDNAGILGAVGVTGLSLYKFGRVVTIPKDNDNVKSPYEMMLKNKEMGLHTLILLDVGSVDGEFELMTAKEGCNYLVKSGFEGEVIVCGGLGSENPEINFGDVNSLSVKKLPQCLIVPGDLHFMEEDVLNSFK
ncbi:diphthine synthase [Candidatus Woesearchaeota archaeon]|jgi:diphthine synthase|nr:diphthine synthase [Candidatus Woesearchaeota archaeon]MBT6044994.1 diphthine synthase [Candidatus Woesearchaeota archaeon]